MSGTTSEDAQAYWGIVNVILDGWQRRGNMTAAQYVAAILAERDEALEQLAEVTAERDALADELHAQEGS